MSRIIPIAPRRLQRTLLTTSPVDVLSCFCVIGSTDSAVIISSIPIDSHHFHLKLLYSFFFKSGLWSTLVQSWIGFQVDADFKTSHSHLFLARLAHSFASCGARGYVGFCLVSFMVFVLFLLFSMNIVFTILIWSGWTFSLYCVSFVTVNLLICFFLRFLYTVCWRYYTLLLFLRVRGSSGRSRSLVC